MSAVRIRIRDDGPLVVEGTIELVDALGDPVPTTTDKPALALCRCGDSQNKPFCDGSHKATGFQSSVRAPRP